MSHDHDWHTFDVEQGLEVRRVGEVYELRRADRPGVVVRLDAAGWDALRDGGPLPEALS